MLRYLIIIGNVLVCNDIFLLFLLWRCRAAFTGVSTSLPFLKMIALAFSLAFSLGFITVWEDNFPGVCTSSRLIMVAIWPIWLSKLWILALASCWNCFVSCWNCKVLVARDLTISSKDIPELGVWLGCCLGGMVAYIVGKLGGFESQADLLVDSHS